MPAAAAQELYVPEMPEERVRCTMSFPASRMGVKKSMYSPALICDVVG